MKYIYICLLLFIVRGVNAQEELKIGLFYYPVPFFNSYTKTFYFPKNYFNDDTKGVKLISIRTANPYIQKTYLISTKGETIWSSFMSSVYFKQNDNSEMIKGFNYSNPYPYNHNSSSTFQSDAFNSFVNTFMSQYKLSIKFSKK